MIRIDFSQEEIELLDWERKHHPHPRVRQKMEVLYFKAMGLPHGQIERLCHIARATLARYLRQYQEGGVGELRKLRFHQPESAMMEYRHELEKSFSENPPSTVNEARDRIERETQLKRSPTAVNRFLKNIGMERRKVGSVPAKADPEQQEAFVEQKLNPRLAEMERGKREIFLSMPRISYGHRSQAFYGHGAACLYPPLRGGNGLTYWARSMRKPMI